MMPQPALTHARAESDIRRLDELIAAIGRPDPAGTGLLLEHLHCARSYLLGVMPDEYAFNLRLARDAAHLMHDKPLREVIDQALSYLLSEVGNPETQPRPEWRHQTQTKPQGPVPAGAHSELWKFFSATDTSFGVFYPKRHIIAIFPSFDSAKAAETALRNAGFGENEILAVPGSEMLRFFEELRSAEGLWGLLMAKLSRTFGTEEVFVDHDIRRAREGAAFLAIYVPLEIDSARACELLMPLQPIAVQRYLDSGIESVV